MWLNLTQHECHSAQSKDVTCQPSPTVNPALFVPMGGTCRTHQTDRTVPKINEIKASQVVENPASRHQEWWVWWVRKVNNLGGMCS